MAATTRRSRRPRSVRGALLGGLAAVLFASGGAVGAGVVFAPDVVERLVGEAKVTVQQTLAPDVATVTLNGAGGASALNAAGHGDFVEMVGYRQDDVPTVYAAHNNRGGDVVLGWDIGQHVEVVDAATGQRDRYVFVDERVTPKWGDAGQLAGMRATIALQTCFYGVAEMRFVGLIPLEEWEADRADAVGDTRLELMTSSV